MKNIAYTIQLLVLLVACLSHAEAATDRMRMDTTDANEGLKDLQMVLENTGLEFYASFNRETTDTSGITRDTLLAYYSTWGASFRSVFADLSIPDSVLEINHIQNDREHITVDGFSKVISINKRISIMQSVFQLDLLDPQFVSDHVQRMYAIDSLNYKVLKVEFKPESPYLFYTLSYDPAKLEPLELDYATKLELANGATGYDRIRIIYGYWFPENYFYADFFSTEQYYTRINGVYVLTTSYSDYEIIDLSAF